MDEIKFLDCPFCGKQPSVTKHFKEPIWRLTHSCPVIGGMTLDWQESIADLAKTWNTRAP